MGGLDSPTQGTVFIDGVEITKLPENRLIDFRLHNIGFVFQSFNLIPVLTAKENIGFVLQLLRMPRVKREERVLTLLKEVGLENKLNSKPGELSGGSNSVWPLQEHWLQSLKLCLLMNQPLILTQNQRKTC